MIVLVSEWFSVDSNLLMKKLQYQCKLNHHVASYWQMLSQLQKCYKSFTLYVVTQLTELLDQLILFSQQCNYHLQCFDCTGALPMVKAPIQYKRIGVINHCTCPLCSYPLPLANETISPSKAIFLLFSISVSLLAC